MIALLASLLLCAPPPPRITDPHGGASTWDAPDPVAQAERDTVLPAAATGAIFVPTMTTSGQEPEYLVRKPGGALIATTRTGARTWVQPGTYRVLVCSGAPETRLQFEVEVVEGETTFIPVEWGGLVVNVVNERGTPFRGSFELVRLPDREFVGVGLGANVSEGEEVTTWLLRPGKFLILSAGESYRARKNFATVRVIPGELIKYTLVLDETTGDILGAGEVDDQGSTIAGPWSLSLLLGGSFSFNRADAVIGKSEGMTLDITGFLELLAGYRDPNHVAYGRLYAEEEGVLRLTDSTYVSGVDQLDIDLLYMWRLVRWFGPYARVSLETQMVPGVQVFDDPTTVIKQDNNRQELSRQANQTEVQLTPPFSPIDFRYGAGGRFDVSPVYWFSLSARAGIGARHLFTRGLFVGDGFGDEGFVLHQAQDRTQVGAEASIITELRVTRWVLLKLDTDLLAPFDDIKNPVLDLRATLSLRLASFASLNYTLRVIQDSTLTDKTQVDQIVLLRFAYKIL